MASGHVNRTERPNTWQHRPSLRREDFSCQPGAVHTWHFCDMPNDPQDVRLSGNTGSGHQTVKPTRLTQLRHRLSPSSVLA
jgi:hypothetical protein